MTARTFSDPGGPRFAGYTYLHKGQQVQSQHILTPAEVEKKANSMSPSKSTADAVMGALIKAAKSKKSSKQIAVYDANGKLVGLVDPDDLQPVAQADGSDADGSAAAAKVQANAPQAAPAQEAVEGVVKAVEMAHLHPDVDLRVEVRKAGASAGTLAAQFDAVLKSMPVKDSQRVQDAVGWLATHLAVGQGVPHTKAVTIAKTAAVKAAQAKAAPQPDTLQVLQGRLRVAGR